MSQTLVNVAIAASVYLLVGLGFGLIFVTGRFFHFAHGATYTWGAYAAYAATRVGFPLPVAFAAGVAIAACLGTGCETLVYRPLRRRGGGSLAILLASLGLYVLLQNVLSLHFGDANHSYASAVFNSVLVLGGARVTVAQLVILAATLVLLALLMMASRHTHVGLVMRAVANDPDLARALGVDVDRTLTLAFVIGSALAGAAGVLIGLDVDLTPTMGFRVLVLGVAATIVGGIGSIEGTAIGALTIAAAQSLGVWVLPSRWQDSLAFGLLAFFLVLRPQGLHRRGLGGVLL